MREPGASRAAVLGGLAFFCGIFGPFAVVSGIASLRRIRASQGRFTGENSAAFGVIAGSLGTLFLGGGILYWLGASL